MCFEVRTTVFPITHQIATVSMSPFVMKTVCTGKLHISLCQVDSRIRILRYKYRGYYFVYFENNLNLNMCSS